MNKSSHQSNKPIRVFSVLVLQEESPNRMFFTSHGRSMAIFGFIAGFLVIGMMIFIVTRMDAGWFPVICFGILSFIFFAVGYKSYFTKQSLELNRESQTVRFVYSAPGDSFEWTKSFSEFKMILLLHHYSAGGKSTLQVELVPQEGETIHLGYSIAGTVSESSAKELAQKLSEFTGVEVKRKDWMLG